MSTDMTNGEILPPPEEFLPVETTGPFMAMLGPLYYRTVDGGMIIALRMAEKHLNRRGIAHGGMLVTLADSAMGMNLACTREPRLWTVTSSLSTDFIDAARKDDWVEAHVEILKIGARLAYASCYLTVGTRRILRASGVFAVVHPVRPDESSEG
jgi:uncharacterized protein (TIGR00369 family)